MATYKGTITQVSPPSEPQGQYNVRYQTITVTDLSGQTITGRIGSKNGYSYGEEIEITVEKKTGRDGPYNYFRKVRPPQDTPSRQKEDPNWDEIARGKTLCAILCAAIQSKQIGCNGLPAALALTDCVMKQRASLPAPPRPAAAGGAGQNYSEEPTQFVQSYPEEPTDDLPF